MIARTSRPPSSQRAQHYALLVDSLEDEHEHSVVLGCLAAARELDARLVVAAGGPVDAPDPRLRAKNFVFDLLGPQNALGLLVLSSALGNAVGPTRLQAWLERYAGTPLCCMGVPIADHISVRVDNAGGIREAVHHLVDVHSKRNIGFIRGPAQSEEAEVRLVAYRDALQAHGIAPDPRWVAEGDYDRPSGARAVRQILDQKRVSVQALDALVCANDYMALGALDELNRRGISVPEQIALTGFDDVASAAAARPALTTVKQPGSELGREGLKQLVLLASGASPERDRVLPVELKLRRSCGCIATELGLAERVHGASLPASFEAALIQRRQVIVAELARAAQGSFGSAGSDWESALLSALLQELQGTQPGALSRRMQRVLQKVEQGGGDPAAAPSVLSILRRQALLCVADSSEARNRLEDAIADAQQVTTSMLLQAAAGAMRSTLQRSRALARQVQEGMFGRAADVSQALATHLPALGVDACVVVALSNPPAAERMGQVICGFAPGQGHPDARAIDVSLLLQHPLLTGSRALFLLPITLAAEPLGVAAVSVASPRAQADLLEELRDLFAVVLKVARSGHG